MVRQTGIKITGLLAALAILSCSVLPQSVALATPTMPALMILPTATAVPVSLERIEPIICPTCPSDCATVIVVTATPDPANPQITAPPVTANPESLEVTTAAPSTATFTPEPSFTPSVTATLKPMPYAVQGDAPIFMSNLFHSDKGCNYLGIGGQVLDKTGKWSNNIVVMVQGNHGGAYFDLLSLTGVAPYFGPGGYDIQLSDQLFDSVNAFSITLYDLAGEAISNPLQFSTLSDCSKNQLIINFKQNVQ